MKLLLVFVILILGCNKQPIPKNLKQIKATPKFTFTGKYEFKNTEFSAKLKLFEDGSLEQTITSLKNDSSFSYKAKWLSNPKQEIDSYNEDRVFPFVFTDSIWDFKSQKKIPNLETKLILNQEGNIKIIISGIKNENFWRKI